MLEKVCVHPNNTQHKKADNEKCFKAAVGKSQRARKIAFQPHKSRQTAAGPLPYPYAWQEREARRYYMRMLYAFAEK